MTGRAVGRGRLGHVTGAIVVVLVVLPVAAGATTPVPTATETSPDDAATPEASVPSAVCHARASFEHQVVGCRAEGLVPGGAVVLRVHPDEAPGSPMAGWVSGVRAGEDGTAQAEVALPCTAAGTTTVEVSGPTIDDGRFRHEESLGLPGACTESPLVSPDAWVLLAAAVVGVSVIVVGMGTWRHVSRRRRVTGSSDRGRRRPRGRGRPRPRRRQQRHRSRARHRRRRSR